MPNVVMLIPADAYRALPLELREQLLEKALLVGIGEKGTFRIDKSEDESVPDHVTPEELGRHLHPGAE